MQLISTYFCFLVKNCERLELNDEKRATFYLGNTLLKVVYEHPYLGIELCNN